MELLEAEERQRLALSWRQQLELGLLEAEELALGRLRELLSVLLRRLAVLLRRLAVQRQRLGPGQELHDNSL